MQTVKEADFPGGKIRNRHFRHRSILLAALALALTATPVLAKRKKTATKTPARNASEIFFKEGLKRLKGKNTCFITNAAGLGRYFLYDAMEETDKYIHAQLEKHEIKIAHLFTPEHGLTGQEDDHGNTKVKAGAPETIYLTTVEKLQEKIADCEAIVFDLPDSGVRPYTYRTVLNRIMRAMDKAQTGQMLYLIDVPNPASHLGPQGPVAQKSNFSYVGERKFLSCPASRMQSSRASSLLTETSRSKFIFRKCQVTNQNNRIQSAVSCFIHHPPICHTSDQTNVIGFLYSLKPRRSKGRITKDPFCQIGHPGFANAELPRMGNVKFSSYPFYAWSGKHKGKLLPGYKLSIDEKKIEPARAAYEFLLWHIKNGADDWMAKYLTEKQGLDAQTGTTSMRKALLKQLTYDQFMVGEKKKIRAFTEAMQKYRLYGK